MVARRWSLIAGLVLWIGVIPPAVTIAAPKPPAPAPPPAASLVSTRCPSQLTHAGDVDCFTLRVPEARTGGSQRIISVAVAIVRAAQATQEPILYIQGGPDAPGIQSFTTTYFHQVPYAEHRDVIIYDTRGTGMSVPYLNCPEIDQMFEAAWPAEPTLEADVAANRACRDRLARTGIDLTRYGHSDSALDLRDLRLLLGIPKWNVIGLSAGGETTFALMRLDRSGIRSVVLDSAMNRASEPPFDHVHGGLVLAEKMFAACRAQASCDAAFPSLKARYLAEIARLDANPFDAEIPVVGGGTITERIDGGLLIDELAWSSAYQGGPPVGAPAWFDHLANGGIADLVAQLSIEPPFPTNQYLPEGRTVASRCRENMAFLTDRTLRDRIRAQPLGERFFRRDYDWGKQICAAWNVGQSDPAGFGYLDSSIPVLTLGGEFDNDIDTSKSIEQAGHLPNGTLVLFPETGHIQLFNPHGPWEGCARSIAADFLADPSRRPDTGCADAIPPIVFDTP